MDFSGLPGELLLEEYDDAVMAVKEFESYVFAREVFTMTDDEQAEHRQKMARESARQSFLECDPRLK